MDERVNSLNILKFKVNVFVIFLGGGRKIVPELTTVAIFLYFVYGMPPQHGLMSGV